MKKAFRSAIAVLFVLVFAVVGLSSVMSVSADVTPDSFDGVYDNLALNKTGFASSVSLKYPIMGHVMTPNYALDGVVDDTSRWQTNVDDNAGDSYMGADLGEATTFNTVVLEWENKITKAAFKIEYSKDAVLEELTFSADAHEALKAEFSYNTVNSGTWHAVENVEIVTGDKFNVISFDSVEARYVRVYITGDSGITGCDASTPSFYEFSVYNVVEEEPATIGDGTVTAETAVVDGVKSVFVATNVAEADVPAGASIKAVFSFTANGTLVEDEELITAAYTSIALGEQTVTAADITGADSNDYVTGILFVNVPESVDVNDIVVNFYVAE